MKLLLCLSLGLLMAQPRPAKRHWCQHPVRQLRWLKQKIQNAQSWPPYHYGWEVHQARYRAQEVFVLHLCRYCGNRRGFLLYNHYGDLIGQGEGADSVWLNALTQQRLLASHPGRMMVRR